MLCKKRCCFFFLVYIPKAFHVPMGVSATLFKRWPRSFGKCIMREVIFRACENLPGMYQTLCFGKLELVYFHIKKYDSIDFSIT